MSQRERLRALPALRGPLPEFAPEGAPGEPFALFASWLEEAVAAGVPEPHAVTVSTVDAEGHPDARVVILKDVDAAAGFSFASARASVKGAQLAHTPFAALSFYWPLQGRQVRLRGPVREGSAEESAADFLARHPHSRAVVLGGRQSGTLPSREALVRAVDAARARVDAAPGLVAPEWCVYAVRPLQVEFWQGHPHRLHTRLRYARTSPDSGAWERGLLWP